MKRTRVRALAALLAIAAAAGCADGTTGTAAHQPARLGIDVALGTLVLQGEITAVRIVATYSREGASGTLADQTIPYAQGQTREVALTLDLGACLAAQTPASSATQGSCPVTTTVEVLAGTRVLARDVLPTVLVRPGQTVSAPALAARSATTVALRGPAGIIPPVVSLTTGSTTTIIAEPLDAQGVPIAGRTIAWLSSAPAVVSVSNTGVVTALATGSATITATTGAGAGAVVGSTLVNVSTPVAASIAFDSSAIRLGVGLTRLPIVTVRDANGTTIQPTPTLTYSSSAATVASVSAAGVVTGVAAGTAVITARAANGVTGSYTVTTFLVPTSITLTPPATSAFVGETPQLTARVFATVAGTSVEITPAPALTWTSSAPAVATVSNTGRVTALTPGTTTITARTDNGVSATAQVTVSTAPGSVIVAASGSTNIGVGATVQLVATARDANNTTITPPPAVTWESSAPGIATVSTTGLVIGVANGSAIIRARTSNNVVGAITVNVGPTGTFAGRVYDFETNANIVGATVEFLSGSTVVRTATTNADGVYNSGAIGGGPYDVRVSQTGYATATVSSVAVSGDRTVEAVPLARTATGNGSISGQVRNATTNTVLPNGATVELYAGVNNVAGAPIATVISNANGGYQFTNVPAGTYTVQGRASGYSDVRRTTVSYGNSRDNAGQNLLLSPTGAALRIVLTWGDQPADLDSHLSIVNGTVVSNWIYWSARGSCTTTPFACLDIDQVTGRGPETITVTQKITGRYVYSVFNYSVAAGLSTVPISRSQARVDVYGPNGLLATFTPPSAPGVHWTVFDWDGQTVRPINTINDTFPPSTATPTSGLVLDPSTEMRLPAAMIKPRR